MLTALVVVSIICPIYALWIFFLAVMALKRARDSGTLSTPALVMGMPVLWMGLLVDAFVQVTVASLVFLELPRELTVTARLTRLKKGPVTWRQRFAAWCCAHLLNAFDPSGNHCE